MRQALKATSSDLIPTPPTFFHEFAGSLLEFALMEQALELDQVLLIRSEFKADRPGLKPGLDAALCTDARIAPRADRRAGHSSSRTRPK